MRDPNLPGTTIPHIAYTVSILHPHHKHIFFFGFMGYVKLLGKEIIKETVNFLSARHQATMIILFFSEFTETMSEILMFSDKVR